MQGHHWTSSTRIEVFLTLNRKNKKSRKNVRVYGKLGHFLLLVSWYLEMLTVIAVYTPFACYSTKVFFFLFSVQDNILYNPALLLQRLLQRIQTETLLRLMQQDKSISGCLISTLGYPRKKGKKIL